MFLQVICHLLLVAFGRALFLNIAVAHTFNALFTLMQIVLIDDQKVKPGI